MYVWICVCVNVWICENDWKFEYVDMNYWIICGYVNMWIFEYMWCAHMTINGHDYVSIWMWLSGTGNWYMTHIPN